MTIIEREPARTAASQSFKGRRLCLPAAIFLTLAITGCATDADRRSASAGGDIGQLMAAEMRAIERETAGLFGAAPEPKKARRSPAVRTTRSAAIDHRRSARRTTAKAPDPSSQNAAATPPAAPTATADTAITDQQPPAAPAEQAAVGPAAAPAVPEPNQPPRAIAAAPVLEPKRAEPAEAARSAPPSTPVTLNASLNEQAAAAPPSAPPMKPPSTTLADSRKLLDQGKVLAARDVLMAGWEMNDPEVTLQLARTFDAYYLAQLPSTDSEADPVMARALYAKAVLLGSKKAKGDLERLINR